VAKEDMGDADALGNTHENEVEREEEKDEEEETGQSLRKRQRTEHV